MWPVFFLSLFLVLALASLIVVSAINQFQERKRMVARKVQQLRLRVTELDELATAVDSLVESPQIAGHINDEAIDMVEAMLNLDSENQGLIVIQQTLLSKRSSFASIEREREIYRLRESDAAIARTLYMLNEAGRILRRRQAAEKLNLAEMEFYLKDLAWAHMLVGVVSTVAQGQKVQVKGDYLRAHAYFKRAQQVAVQTSSNDERKNELVKEITNLMHNKAKYLSLRFMPESQPSEHEKNDQTASEAPL